MIFFVGNDGTIIKSLPSPVYQGSSNSNTVYLIAPFASNMTVTVAFKLPNGVWTEPAVMTSQQALSGIVNEKTDTEYSGWSYALPNSITRYYGTVTAQFFFYGTNFVTASSATTFEVGRGVPAILPDTPDQDVYEQILESITNLQEDLDNGYYTARSIYSWNSTYTYGAGELVFYPDKGDHGVLLKSLVSDNAHAPYTDGILNSANWEEVTDFNILNSLYSLEGDVSEALKQAQEATERAEQAGTLATQQAESAQESASTAESSAQRVENVAEYIEGVQNGSLPVQKAIEDETGENIAEQFASVVSDIEGLREDFQNESHFRGTFTSVEALKAAYPTATPNDYAYITGGNIWVYQDNAWKDSEEETPNTAIPASNSTPLMDGEGDSGTSSEYARGDHRHPTDTTRASTAVATQTSNGLMSATDKTKLDGLGTNNVTGVKGNAETTYRTGNVNLTPANLGIFQQATVTQGATKVNGWWKVLSCPAQAYANATSISVFLVTSCYGMPDPQSSTGILTIRLRTDGTAGKFNTIYSILSYKHLCGSQALDTNAVFAAQFVNNDGLFEFYICPKDSFGEITLTDITQSTRRPDLFANDKVNWTYTSHNADTDYITSLTGTIATILDNSLSLNGEYATSPTIYAPTSYYSTTGQTSGFLLANNGEGNPPKWLTCTNFSNENSVYSNQGDYVIEYYRTSTFWYRRWKSGWKECGGIIKKGSTLAGSSRWDAVITFAASFTFSTTSYTVTAIASHETTAVATTMGGSELAVAAKKTSGFTVDLYNRNATTTIPATLAIEYYCCGY